MTTLDIRETEEITQILFDNSGDSIVWNEKNIQIRTEANGNIILSGWSNFDNFIKACHKAKELAGK